MSRSGAGGDTRSASLALGHSPSHLEGSLLNGVTNRGYLRGLRPGCGPAAVPPKVVPDVVFSHGLQNRVPEGATHGGSEGTTSPVSRAQQGRGREAGGGTTPVRPGPWGCGPVPRSDRTAQRVRWGAGEQHCVRTTVALLRERSPPPGAPWRGSSRQPPGPA